MMNFQDSGQPATGREARLRYMASDYRVLEPGDFVRCAVTGAIVALDELKYWDVERQLAYRSAAEAFEQVKAKPSGAS